MNHSVAVHWTALERGGVDLKLMDMEHAGTVFQATNVLNRSGLPIMNVVLADRKGHIAWTLTGSIPIRRGFDGKSSRMWADGKASWSGKIPPSDLPRIVDPPSGYIATANNRTVGPNYPYPLGYNYASGFRVHRINERLRAMDQAAERDMFAIQLDTDGRFYEFYQKLALSILTDEALREKPRLAEIRRHIAGWNGKADVNSVGLGLLIQFRAALVEAIVPSFLSRCREVDPNFQYRWFKMDRPLQEILMERPVEILPSPKRYTDWQGLLMAALEQSARQLKLRYSVTQIESLRWGIINTTQIKHPLSAALPIVANLLDMPVEELPGCSHCVRVARHAYGASERLVVAPGHLADAILHMPGGESGNPLSDHYADQQPYWVHGLPLPLLSAKETHRLTLVPGDEPIAYGGRKW